MRRLLYAAALIGVGAAIGFGTVVVGAGASPTPESTNTMLTASGTSTGQPLPIRVAGSGFAPGGLVYIEQCDGTPPTAVGWSPTSNCDLGSSPAPVLADPTGNVVYQPDDANHAFTPFKGESPQSLFNCLSPNEPALNAKNSLPDFRNCQVRLSSDDINPTADQKFYDLTLPDAVWEAPFAHPVGSCSGQRVLGSWKPTALSNTATSAESLGTTLMKTVASPHTPFSGTCTATGVPVTLTPKAFSLKVTGTARCTATSDDAPLVGKLTITMNEIDPVTTHPYKILATVRRTPGVDPTAPDIALYQGTITAGVGLGDGIVGTLFEDPVTKAAAHVVTTTGYVDTPSLLTQCQAGSATISTVEIGAGTSKFGGIASGLHFGY